MFCDPLFGHYCELLFSFTSWRKAGDSAKGHTRTCSIHLMDVFWISMELANTCCWLTKNVTEGWEEMLRMLEKKEEKRELTNDVEIYEVDSTGCFDVANVEKLLCVLKSRDL